MEAVKSFDIRTNLRFPVKSPEGDEIWPKRQWRWGKERFEEAIKNDEVIFKKNSKGEWTLASKQYLFDEQGDQRLTKFQSVITDIFTQEGTKEILNLFGDNKVFDFPKPTSLIKKLLAFNSKKNSIILDFFAGSGTTAQAVMSLNEDTKDKMQFILVTDNENEIMKKVCYPRITKVIKGYKDQNRAKIKGIGNSLKYYKTDFIGKNNILNASDEDKVELAHNAGELLAIAENTLELVKQTKYYQLFEDNLKEKYTAVYFREELDQFEKFVEMVKKLDRKTIVYVFSWGAEEFIDDFDGLKNIKIKTIPVPILEIYKNIYNLII